MLIVHPEGSISYPLYCPSFFHSRTCHTCIHTYIHTYVQVFDRSKIRDRYLQSDFLLDFLAILPVDLLAYFSGSSGHLIAFLRLPKLMHTPKLYRVVRATNISERSSSTARLLADIQSLYTLSLAMIHILACAWYYMTEGYSYYDTVSHFDILGDPIQGSVSTAQSLFHHQSLV